MAILLERDTSFEESAYLYYNVATSLNLIISKIEEDRGVSSELERFLEDTDWFLDRASDKVNSLTGYIKSQYPAYVLPPRLSESVNYHTGCVFGICKDMVTFL